jgi:ABC-type transport system involved in cytochrome c biogenesis permease subunit
LAATSVLSATILMVAGLSWLDPEITPLVPVLKSYWLTIHVSMIAGSYGFLMLGAIIGVLNLILMIFKNKKNGKNANRIIKEMTYISEMTLIGGLFMVSIGTYLGGIWANESWGRYWAWDNKETWTFIILMIYTVVLHFRLVPKLNNRYIFNIGAILSFATVLMTFFGTNYYFNKGIHNYASENAIGLPLLWWAVLLFLFTLILIAGIKQRIHVRNDERI